MISIILTILWCISSVVISNICRALAAKVLFLDTNAFHSQTKFISVVIESNLKMSQTMMLWKKEMIRSLSVKDKILTSNKIKYHRVIMKMVNNIKRNLETAIKSKNMAQKEKNTTRKNNNNDLMKKQKNF